MADVPENEVLKALAETASPSEEALLPVPTEEDAVRYRALLADASAALTDELAKAVRKGRLHIHLGVWYRPYLYEHKRLKPSFTPHEALLLPALVALYKQATEEGMVDVLDAELRKLLAEAYEGRVSLDMKDLSITPKAVIRAPRIRQYKIVVAREQPAA